MSLTKFNNSDIIVQRLDTANPQVSFSTSAQAAASSVWIFVANSTTGGFLPKPDTSSQIPSNISISSAFRHIANYFYGTSTYVPDPLNNSTQRTTIRVIQIGRPTLDEGLYPNSISATIVGTNYTLLSIDFVNNSSANSPLGLTGQMVDSSNTSSVLGTVFYDHGVIVFHGGSTLTSPASGFSIRNSLVNSELSLTNLTFQSRNVVKRTTFFTRAFNTDYNYTTNPTARNSDGSIIASLTANPTTFITTVGLYDDNNNLLAIGKVNPAKRKDATSECIFRVQISI